MPSTSVPVEAEPNTQPTSAPVIACIDDSQTVQRQLKLLLENYGYQVLNLSEPLQALTRLARQKPDLIVLDVTMPDLDGYELCRMLRRSTLLADVPILILTGKNDMLHRIRARGVGATDFLGKPVSPQDLLERINQLLLLKQS
mgnify:CR=1 FL=1